ncbi:MAG: T9SS type A sorting domain-containing protein [bacterium]
MKKIFAIIILCYFIGSETKAYSQEISGYKWDEVTNIPEPYNNIYWLDVFFLKGNPDYGWICGYGGNILRTTNGGETWSGTKIMDIVIDTIDIGGNIVYDTTFIPTINQLESVHFSNQKIGYASGESRVFKSTDGGASWRSVIDTGADGDIWGVFFITLDIGMAVGGGCDGSQYFRRTTNGGQSWTTFIGHEPESGLSDVILESLYGEGYASSSGLIWKTTNGGVTWNTLCSTGDRDWQEDIAVSGNTILVPYSEGCYGGGIRGGLRISKDLGKTWRDFPTTITMFGAFLLDSMRGWGVGQQNSIYYTYNAGESWHLLNSGIKTNAPLDDIWFIDDTTGWVVGRGVYKFTGNVIVDVDDNTFNNTIIESLLPNPVNDDLKVLLNSNNKTHLSILSLTGHLLIDKEVFPTTNGLNEVNFDLSNLSSGLYFLQVQSGEKTEFQKIVKY